MGSTCQKRGPRPGGWDGGSAPGRHPAAAADLSKWSAFDWCGGRIHVRTASGPHVATIIYPQFSTTHFYLLITGLILTHIPESFNPNLVETQNIILNPKKRVGALLKFRVQETRKTCKIFIEMEEVLKETHSKPFSCLLTSFQTTFQCCQIILTATN